MECPMCHKATRTTTPCSKCGVAFITARPAGRGQCAWVGVPRRPVIASEITTVEDGIEAGIFDNSRGSYIAATRSLLPENDNPHFENARRAREDGR